VIEVIFAAIALGVGLWLFGLLIDRPPRKPDDEDTEQFWRDYYKRNYD
jgi:hypothetical protein